MKFTITMDLTKENLEKVKMLLSELAETNLSDTSTAPATEEQAKPETAQTVKSEETEAEAITKTDIRAVALKLSKAGKPDVLAEIFKKFGCKKLSDFDKRTEDYPALMRELVNANA